MQQIVPPIRIVQKVLGEKKTLDGIPHRLSTHCMCVAQPEGVLFYHALTGELLLLSNEEAALLRELPGPVPEPLVELAARWFLCLEDADDMALANQTRAIAERFERHKSARTRYMIFTTMECNARCFYCYEGDWKRATMSEQIARDTANYIAAHCDGRLVHLEWFGGEPLVNVRAIDEIASGLRLKGVEFRSTMTSNGYLFNEALVRRAREVWNLDRVQITLDGTERVYNQRKAYVNPQGSPYRRVLCNIGLLLDAGIQVTLRLNMDEDNERDLYTLVDELAERFARKPGFGVASKVIYEHMGLNPPSYTEAERNAFVQKLESLRAYMEQKGVAYMTQLERGFVANACSADSESFTTITPEGMLGRCGACKEGDIWGSIYSDVANAEVLQQWKERKPPVEACKTCAIYPQCIRLKKCPSWEEQCSPVEQSLRIERRRRAILGAYKEWKAVGSV